MTRSLVDISALAEAYRIFLRGFPRLALHCAALTLLAMLLYAALALYTHWMIALYGLCVLVRYGYPVMGNAIEAASSGNLYSARRKIYRMPILKNDLRADGIALLREVSASAILALLVLAFLGVSIVGSMLLFQRGMVPEPWVEPVAFAMTGVLTAATIVAFKGIWKQPDAQTHRRFHPRKLKLLTYLVPLIPPGVLYVLFTHLPEPFALDSAYHVKNLVYGCVLAVSALPAYILIDRTLILAESNGDQNANP